MSLPETLLWRELRKRPSGFKYRRQHPAGAYILDFYCASVRLAIEVDGAGHDGAEAAKRDARRSDFLRSQHVATLRVPATVVLKDIEGAVKRIVAVCEERAAKISGGKKAASLDLPLHHPSDGPPPPLGEDR